LQEGFLFQTHGEVDLDLFAPQAEINSQARVESGSPFLVAKDLGSLNLFRQGVILEGL
jgi:hypothetical protein